ncbi:hypothetical protein CfE428DRAFT_4898 [Chthoniobacter flavus Ellin428]|uniref:Uncharacterized protein n=1 Tax=Chthoniobacter flavus Ellin428 TaxID=497964 RepID=B4D7I3_9BACT|nr:hypothetical protein [Chthoniobacter flavus]EDY17600.1 hypothetical protein CfE428DRAFT_4898 [Chthoniobacter flavus Ellin428]TCO92371.1 hypothetical protein EV701_106140 [Chthoniobacter flavus]
MAELENPQAFPDKTPSPVPTKSKNPNRIRRIIFAPFTLVAYLVRGKSNIDEIVVYSAPRAFYLWIVIAVGFALKFLVPLYLSASAGAWIFITTLVFFILALLYDMSLKKLALWVLVIAALWLLCKYLENLRDIVILGPIVHHFAMLDPQYDHGTVTVLCWLLLIPWVCSLFEMRFDRKKKFSPNEIAEFHFGEGSELTDRSGLRFVTKYRDVLETVLSFGGGDLLAVDNHQTVIKRYENIIGLWFYWEKLDRVLHQRATLLDDEAAKDQAAGDQPAL